MAELEYRLLRADEANDLRQFIVALYGDSYPSDLFAKPGRIAAAIENGQLFSSIALDSGKIVGHLATYREYEGDITADGITNMVHPQYRGMNIMSSLSEPMMRLYPELPIRGLHLYAVTRHDIAQRKSQEAGAPTTGVLLEDWPGHYAIEGFEEPFPLPRMPIVMMFMPFGTEQVPSREVYLPAAYARHIQDFYAAIGLARKPATVTALRSHPTNSQLLDRPLQGMATQRFHQLGEDWATRTATFNRDLRPAAYIDLPLTDPRCPEATDELRKQGWYFGGLLPERKGTDYLRLQSSSPAQDWSKASFTDASQKELEFILADAASVGL